MYSIIAILCLSFQLLLIFKERYITEFFETRNQQWVLVIYSLVPILNVLTLLSIVYWIVAELFKDEFIELYSLMLLIEHHNKN